MSMFKAQAMARDLKMRLELSIAGITVTQYLDANGFPTLKVMKSSDLVGYCKIEDFGNFSRIDGLGLTQRSYSPEIIKVAQEDIGTTAPTTMAERYPMLAEIVKCGSSVSIYEKEALADSETDVDTIAALSLLCEIKSDVINPVLSSQ